MSLNIDINACFNKLFSHPLLRLPPPCLTLTAWCLSDWNSCVPHHVATYQLMSNTDGAIWK